MMCILRGLGPTLSARPARTSDGLKSAGRLDCPISQCVIVGDTVWDQLAARRASTIGAGVLTGGYTEDELCRAGAYRVYRDAAELTRHLCEFGIQIKH